MKSMQVIPIRRAAFMGEVVEGCVLGDATVRKTSASAFFRMTQCKERTDFLSVIAKVLSEHGVLVKFDPYADGKFDIRTPTHQYWKEVRERFYPDGAKVIPEDLVPTRSSLLFFYLCDGYFMSADNYERYYSRAVGVTKKSEWCYLSTYNFTWENVEAFKSKIELLVGCEGVIYPQRQNNKVYPRLVFRGDNCLKFLEYVYVEEYVPQSMISKFPDYLTGKEAVIM